MTTLTFKVADDDARRLRSRARQAKLSLSEYMRRRLLDEPSSQTDIGLVVCPITGARVFAPLPNRPPLSTEGVRELLADFP